MISASLFFAAVLLGFFVWQAILTGRFVAALRQSQTSPCGDEDCPKAAVILCLRGQDPSLGKCLEGLLNQDYPRYDVHVVIDHETDPSLPLVESFVKRAGGASKLRFEFLREHGAPCTLKCSSLVQALEELDRSYEVVALIDADTVPHSTWLRELIGPLQDSAVGASTGCRWYAPDDPTLGSVARYWWNVSALVQMVAHQIPWGGSLALRAEILHETTILDSWSRAFCEDTMLLRFLSERNLRLAFVPTLIMVNRETCGVSDFFRWMIRQLITVRLYHPRWAPIFIHGLLTGIVPLLFTGLLAIALAGGQSDIAFHIGSAILVYGGAVAGLWLWVESGVRRIIRTRKESVTGLSASTLGRSVAAISLLHLLHPLALAAALRLGPIAWRGIVYQVKGPWSILSLGYSPYRANPESPAKSL